MNEIIGEVVLYFGLLLSAFGVYSLLRLDRFYSRLVITSKVETMGLLTVMLGAMIIFGFSSFTVKILIILFFELITLPVGSHAVARSAYMNGFRAPPGMSEQVKSSTGQDSARTGDEADA